jgi:hypothetical protein
MDACPCHVTLVYYIIDPCIARIYTSRRGLTHSTN